MWQSCLGLRRPHAECLCCPRKGAHVAQACIASRLLHGAGTWLALSPAQLRKVQGHYMRPLRRIAGHDSPPAEGQRWPTVVETLRATGQALVQAHVVAARLRLATRISLRGTPAAIELK